ncbi:hypothetical protein QE444_000351 [Pseudomonas sp. SORGH_AS199]|uniref:DUF4214 domain-containing protein n=1 Tax=Pseudomonas sp. SORGH_AS_0199 TaxID=3041761 RepID=UPI00285B15B6|nr:DUF4214 domain-containing protein [Pseudomonas sp. SORGH_AS_0199]MDR6227994.1 hypothetical protein [Pseudomonas sp. SORGH_AS_0199]
MAVTSAQIQELYIGYFGRPADQAGLNYWLNTSNAANSTVTLNDIRASFAQQTEYTSVYGSLDRQATVTQIYQNLFGRTASADEVGYWTFTSANTPKENLIQAFLEAASANDRAVVNAKSAFADQLTSTFGSATGTNFADLKAPYTAAVAVAVAEQQGANPPAASASYQAAFTAAAANLGYTATTGGAITFNAFDKASATVTVPATQAALTAVDINGSKLTDATVAHAYGTTASTAVAVDFADAANLTSLKLNLTTSSTDEANDNVTLTLTAPTTSKLATLDASGSNVDLTFNATTATALTSITTGSGDDTITVATGTYTAAVTSNGVVTTPAVQAKAIAVNTGAGNDAVTATVKDAAVQINVGAGNDDVTLNFATFTQAAGNHGAQVTLGAGQDDLFLGTGNNIQYYAGSDAAKAGQLSAGLVTVSGFNAAEGDIFHAATGATATSYYNLANVSQGTTGTPNAQLVTFNNATTLAAKLDAAAALMNSASNAQTGGATPAQLNTIHFEFNGNTYVYADKASAGAFGVGDSVVELTGVTGLTATAFA